MNINARSRYKLLNKKFKTACALKCVHFFPPRLDLLLKRVQILQMQQAVNSRATDLTTCYYVGNIG